MSDARQRLAGFEQLGVRWTSVNGQHARGRCPFCGDKAHQTDASQHFCANTETLAWDCKSCGAKGNFATYLELAAAHYAARMTAAEAAPLATDRGVKIATLRRWGVGYHSRGGCYTLPMVEMPRGNIVGVRRYFLRRPKTQRARSVTGGKNGLFVAHEDGARGSVWVCEGEWDAMALDDALRGAKISGRAVGVPGAASARESLAQIAQGRNVVLAYDHDDGGRAGDAKARAVLQGRVTSLASVHWPADRPEGFDVRDLYAEHEQAAEPFLAALQSYVNGASPTSAATTAGAAPDESAPLVVPERADVVAAWRKWLYLPDEEIVDVMFGAALAHRFDGDPLWLFVVGPPGCGKTGFLLHFGEAANVVTTTTLTPATLISGMQRAGNSDPSLIPRLGGKVLVVKDFTTILSLRQEAREEIFGILRDAFDGKIEKFFGNGVHRCYTAKFGIIAGVTSKIEEHSAGNVVCGERFLRYRIRPHGGRVRVGERAIRRALQNRDRQAEMHAELDAVCRSVLDAPWDTTRPALGSYEIDRIVGMAQWVAAMRGAVPRDRYTRDITYMPESEVGTRVATQLEKFACGIAMFRGQRTITTKELAICARVARDSVPAILESIVKALYIRRRDGWATATEIGAWIKLPTETVSKALDDSAIRGVTNKRGSRGQVEWQLSRALARVMLGLDLYVSEKQWAR